MKRILIFVFLVFCFAINVDAADVDELYAEQLENSGFFEVIDGLPDEVRDFLAQSEINIDSADWVEHINISNAFKMIWSFISSGGKRPLLALGEIVGVIVIYAAVNAVADEKSGVAPSLSYIFSIIIALTLIKNIIISVNGCASAIKGTGVFMLSFVPVFIGIITVSGAPTSAATAGALLLAAAEFVVQSCAFLIIPLMSAYLGLGVATGVSPLIKDSGIADAIKKIAMWVLSFCFTIFIGFLSIQNVISASADSVTVKTAKFMVGSFVPVVGSSLSEALTTVLGSVSLLKNSVGMYAVIAILVMLLPIVAELLLWRVSIMLCSAASSMFSLPKIPQILKAIDSVLAVFIGIVLFVGALFIIALAIVTRAGG